MGRRPRKNIRESIVTYFFGIRKKCLALIKKSAVVQKKIRLLPVILFLFVIILAVAGAFYSNASKSQVDETADLVARVGKLIILPKGETPTIATVSDPEKLRGQAFFANAKVGDKVLIFSEAKKAILYDPVANMIIEVAPLNIDSPAIAPAATTSTSNRQ